MGKKRACDLVRGPRVSVKAQRRINLGKSKLLFDISFVLLHYFSSKFTDNNCTRLS